MASRKIRFPLSILVLIVFGTVVLSLHLMSSATQDSSGLGRMYSSLLLINTLGTVLLLVLVGVNVHSLARQFKKRKAGSRLTRRMVFLFVLLTLAPASIVFYYSMQFLHQSIDSWFDVRIDSAMEDALELSQAALDQRMRGLLAETTQMAATLETVPDSLVSIVLNELRNRSSANELTLISRQGAVIASNSQTPGEIIPSMPDDSILLQLRQGEPYVGLNPGREEGLLVRTVVPVGTLEPRFLQALYSMPVRISNLAETVESAYVHFKKMSYLRGALKQSFSLTLALVLLLSLLAAIWVAFISIRRIVAPVRDLAKGTREVAAGNYEQRLPVLQKDELGFLVESFNEMTKKIGHARDEADESRQEVEHQRAYLETVLGNLSSGVLSFDAGLRLRTANPAADKMLHVDMSEYTGKPLSSLAEDHRNLKNLATALQRNLESAKAIWEVGVAFVGPNGKQALVCRGTPLYSPDGFRSGAVMVFDDMTKLIQAQRNAAWGEVAQRLAHEIKNPLTPIQLSAERLKHKLSRKLESEDARVLDRAIATIVQQVEALKTMVNVFSEYARPPKIQPEILDMNGLIEEVLALYPPQTGLDFQLALSDHLPGVEADPVRMRQVLHNLIKNAQEALDGTRHGKILVSSRGVIESGAHYVEIVFRDNGPGIAPELAEQVFEPYVTNKAKGTGLGLAIVKKIIEEHDGVILIDSNYQNGAGFVIRLPVAAEKSEPMRLSV